MQKDHPNLFGAAVFSAILGFVFAILTTLEFVQKQTIAWNGMFVGIALFFLTWIAYRKHRELQIMSPEERDIYWVRRGRIPKERR